MKPVKPVAPGLIPTCYKADKLATRPLKELDQSFTTNSHTSSPLPIDRLISTSIFLLATREKIVSIIP